MPIVPDFPIGWTPQQKTLAIAAAVLAFVLLGALMRRVFRHAR